MENAYDHTELVDYLLQLEADIGHCEQNRERPSESGWYHFDETESSRLRELKRSRDQLRQLIDRLPGDFSP